MRAFFFVRVKIGTFSVLSSRRLSPTLPVVIQKDAEPHMLCWSINLHLRADRSTPPPNPTPHWRDDKQAEPPIALRVMKASERHDKENSCLLDPHRKEKHIQSHSDSNYIVHVYGLCFTDNI